MISVLRAALSAAVLTVFCAGAVYVSHAVSQAQEVNIEEVFRCSSPDDAGKSKCLEARNLIMNNCTVCHTFVPIVMQQFDAGSWQSLMDRHVGGGRVDQLSPQEVAEIRDYLTANFNPDHPQPDLPPELLETWTSY